MRKLKHSGRAAVSLSRHSRADPSARRLKEIPIASTTEGRAGLRARLAAGETLVGTFLNTGSAISAEICGRAGFDWLLIDLEHGSGSEADLQHQLHAVAGTASAAIVRVESNARPRVAKALDLGAEGIMFPQVHSADDVRAAISYLKYPPEGVRGLAFSNRAHAFTPRDLSAVEAANERAVGVIQIESAAAVAAAEEIASIEGVDALFVGPNDLSLSLGVHGQYDSRRYLEAVERVAAATKATGKAAGVLTPTADGLDRYLARGFRLLTVGSDGAFLVAGASGAVAGTRARASAGV